MRQDVLPDYYEIIQVSPRADRETVERVFRLLAKRLHPDNAETGDADRFSELFEAFRVLSDPEARAAYDVKYDAAREGRWRVFEVGLNGGSAQTDLRVRDAILAVMYQARRQNADQPGIGNLELERLLGCSEEQLRFQLWYLREKGWVERLGNGTLAISVAGVDRVLEQGGPAPEPRELLMPGNGRGNGASHGNGRADDSGAGQVRTG